MALALKGPELSAGRAGVDGDALPPQLAHFYFFQFSAVRPAALGITDGLAPVLVTARRLGIALVHPWLGIDFT